MTLERSGRGTGRYVAGSAVPINDIFQQAAPGQYTRLTGAVGPPRFTILEDRGDEVHFRLEWYTLHGGANKTRGDFLADHGRYANAEGVDARFENHLILSQKVTTQATPDPAAGDLVCDHINFDSTSQLIITMGDLILIETSATDPTITARYSGSNNYLSVGQITTDDNVERIVIGRSDDEAFANNNLSGGFLTMASELTDLYGLAQTSLPGAPIIFYAGGKLYSIDVDEVYTQTPTELIDRIAPGGYVVGLMSKGGAPLRVFFVMPRGYAVTDSMLTFGAERKGRLMSFNQRGRDPQETVLDIQFVKWAFPFRGGIFCASDDEAVWTNGAITRPISWFADRAADSDRLHKFRGFWKQGPKLLAAVNAIAAPNATGNTEWWAEEYDFDNDRIHQITKPIELTTTGEQGVTGPTLPMSEQTGFAHQYVDGAWRRFFVPSAGVNPYSHRQTSGGASGTGVEFEASGFVDLPETVCPGELAYLPKRVKAMHFGGRIENAGAEVKVTETDGTFHEFIYGYGTTHQRKEFEDNGYRFTFPAPRFALTQGANGRTTPQALPIAIDYVAYRNERRALRVPSS